MYLFNTVIVNISLYMFYYQMYEVTTVAVLRWSTCGHMWSFFFNIIFFNPNSKYIARNEKNSQILCRRLARGRNFPFVRLSAETRLSARPRPACMCPAQRAVRGPSFRPADGRMAPFGALAAETCQVRRPTPSSSSSSLLLPGCFLSSLPFGKNSGQLSIDL